MQNEYVDFVVHSSTSCEKAEAITRHYVSNYLRRDYNRYRVGMKDAEVLVWTCIGKIMQPFPMTAARQDCLICPESSP